jgi:hypothetical protein
MAQPPEAETDRLIPLITGERFELALDEKLGAVTTLYPSSNALSVTNLRVINRADVGNKRITSILPHDRITAVEITDAVRSRERLFQGLMVLGIGIALAVVSWAVVGLMLVTLIVGGFPILAAIYMLSGYALPDTEGELVIHAGAHSVRHRLLSADARRDAYLVAGRISELMTAVAVVEEPEVAAPELAPQVLSGNGSPVVTAPSGSWWATWGAPPAL